MDFKNCTHYEELAQVVANNGNLDDVSFELNDTRNCKICTETSQTGEHENVCSLWVQISFVQDIRPQIGMETKPISIDKLEKDFEEVTRRILKSFIK